MPPARAKRVWLWRAVDSEREVLDLLVQPLFMQFRRTDTLSVAVAKASFSPATGHRLARDPRLPSMRKGVRGRRRPDPLAIGGTHLLTLPRGRTTDLVQKLQVARRELALEAAINRLDRFDLLILDDLAYVTKDQAETSVEIISARYERRSMLTTPNQPFGEWGKVFPDPAMTLSAVDRLVHRATIVEMNVESYRRRLALERKRGPGRPPTRALSKTSPD